MKLQEYQAKQLLARYGVPVPMGKVCATPDEVAAAVSEMNGAHDATAVVVKAQVLSGGRGKAGAVKLAKTADEARDFALSILGKSLWFEQAKSELRIDSVLVEEALPIAREYYIGITTDRTSQRNVFIVSSEGGMDIEEVAENHPDRLGRLPVDPFLGLRDFDIRYVTQAGGISADELGKIAPFLKSLYDAFVGADADLAEINPLVVTKNGDFIAGDAKITIDDNALYRHPELAEFTETSEELDSFEKEARRRGIRNYVHLNGNIGILGNGAGLVMGTMDEVQRAGGAPANFLDIGGGAKADLVKNSLELVLSDPNVRGVMINIFGGITRGDEVARGIIEGTSTLDINVPIVVRLAGTRADEGLALLKETNLVPAATMQEAANKIVALAGVSSPKMNGKEA